MIAHRRSALPPIEVSGALFLIIEAPYYSKVSELLHKGASQALGQAGARIETIQVPGALEIPIALTMAAQRSDCPYDGFVALGCIIRGDTYHFEIVANESARALTSLAVSQQLPFGNGILTVDTELQAIERAAPAQGDKGGDAARAALKLFELKRGWRSVRGKS